MNLKKAVRGLGKLRLHANCRVPFGFNILGPMHPVFGFCEVYSSNVWNVLSLIRVSGFKTQMNSPAALSIPKFTAFENPRLFCS